MNLLCPFMPFMVQRKKETIKEIPSMNLLWLVKRKPKKEYRKFLFTAGSFFTNDKNQGIKYLF